MDDLERIQNFLNKGIFYLQQSNNQNIHRAIQNFKLASGHIDQIIFKIENKKQAKQNIKKEINEYSQ